MWASNRARLLRLVEVALVTFGAMCIGWYGGVRAAAAREQASLSHELEIRTVETAAPGSSLAAGTVVGRITLPRLNLSAVAREGVDERTLEVAVGHVPGTSLPGDAGNAAFAAHRDTFFRPRRHIRAGDVVFVTTPRGSYRYVVTSTQIVDPDDVSVLDRTASPMLTLVTCYQFNYIGSAPYRFIVRAALLPAAS